MTNSLERIIIKLNPDFVETLTRSKFSTNPKAMGATRYDLGHDFWKIALEVLEKMKINDTPDFVSHVYEWQSLMDGTKLLADIEITVVISGDLPTDHLNMLCEKAFQKAVIDKLTEFGTTTHSLLVRFEWTGTMRHLGITLFPSPPDPGT